MRSSSPHSHHQPGSKTGGVAQHDDGWSRSVSTGADGSDKGERLAKGKKCRRGFLAAGDHHQAQGVKRNIDDAQEKYKQTGLDAHPHGVEAHARQKPRRTGRTSSEVMNASASISLTSLRTRSTFLRSTLTLQQGDHAILAAGRDLGHGIALLAQVLGDGAAQARS